MSNKVKDMDIKKRHIQFFQRYYQIENSNPSSTKVDEKSYKNILIYHIGYVTIK